MKAYLQKRRLPERGTVQALWRQFLASEGNPAVSAGIVQGLVTSLRASTVPASSHSGSRGPSLDDIIHALPQAVPRALRLAWRRELQWRRLRRQGHGLPAMVAALCEERPELVEDLQSLVALPPVKGAALRPLFGEATLVSEVARKRRTPPKDAHRALSLQLYLRGCRPADQRAHDSLLESPRPGWHL